MGFSCFGFSFASVGSIALTYAMDSYQDVCIHFLPIQSSRSTDPLLLDRWRCACRCRICPERLFSHCSFRHHPVGPRDGHAEPSYSCCCPGLRYYDASGPVADLGEKSQSCYWVKIQEDGAESAVSSDDVTCSGNNNSCIFWWSVPTLAKYVGVRELKVVNTLLV